ncbi:hypothetical protein D3C72_2573070 [compost metagenome]
MADAEGLERAVGVGVDALVQVLDQPNEHGRFARERGIALAGHRQAALNGFEAAHDEGSG